MKIACIQLNATVGDFLGNVEKLQAAYKKAVALGAELVVGPELFICGYPPRDWLVYESFMQRHDTALAHLQSAIGEVPLIVGCVTRNEKRPGKALFNSAVVLQKATELKRFHKTLIPTYDVFDEDRYFEPALATNDKSIVLGGKKIGVTICEDIWNDEDFWDENARMYDCDPVEELMRGKEAEEAIDLLVNVSASPWHLGKEKTRLSMLQELAQHHALPIVQTNLVGGNDELVFDGQSLVINADGELLTTGKAFEEDIFVADVTLRGQAPSLNENEDEGADEDDFKAEAESKMDSTRHSHRMGEEEALFYALSLGTRDYVRKCGFEKVTIGLSGGIDSAVTAVVAVDALGPENVLGVLMPSGYSSEGSITDAEALAQILEIDYEVLPIEKLFRESMQHLDAVLKETESDTTEENMQSRLRGLTLMAIANKQGRLVLTTGNKSELAVGYCTLYGDMCGGLAVISDVTKSQVYKMSRWINRNQQIIPHNTLNKPPSAELRPDQKDEDSLPLYDVLDAILEAYIEQYKGLEEIVALGYERELVEDILRKVDSNEYKRRQAAPGLKVTAKAFGIGRRMPVAQGFKHKQ
ncbi:MAG: NAD+ synthase [Verrucomicrobiota bacterium]